MAVGCGMVGVIVTDNGWVFTVSCIELVIGIFGLIVAWKVDE